MANHSFHNLCRIYSYCFITFILLHQCYSLTCSSTSSSPTPITSTQVTLNRNQIIISSCSFTGYTNVEVYGVRRGPISGSLYYMYKLPTPAKTAIRKINLDDSLAWMTVVAFSSVVKSFSVDSNEQYVYFCRIVYPITVIRLQTSDGAIVDSINL